MVMIVGLIGTTITPWMQFYLQASIVEKGVSKRNYGLSRIDVIFGCIVTDVIAFFIVVACAATIYQSRHREITDVAEAAKALGPFAGKFAAMLFAVGLVNASLMSAAILPLATAYNICEGLGFESGIDRSFCEAPIFYGLYTMLIVCGAGFVLIPRPAAAESDPAFAGGKRHPAAVRAGLHADADQPRASDGRVPERTVGKLDRDRNQRHYGAADDRADLQQRHGVRPDSLPLPHGRGSVNPPGLPGPFQRIFSIVD